MSIVLIGLDLETTGVDPAKDEPVQAAAIYSTLREGEFSDPKVLFNGYCNPSTPYTSRGAGSTRDLTRNGEVLPHP